MRNQKGITLIALVITIIVLLILAGVAIAMLSGENGILNQAGKSAKDTVVSTAKEQIGLVVNEAIADYYEEVYVASNNNTTSAAGVQVYIVDVLANLTDDQKKEMFDDQVKYTAPTAITEKTEAGVEFTIEFLGDNTVYTATVAKDGKLTWDK